MHDGVCVGGYLIVPSRCVRLIPVGRRNHPLNTNYDVGQIWDIQFNEPAQVTPPHTEDIYVTGGKLVDHIPNVQIDEIIPIYQGSVDGLYEGLISFTSSGSGYTSQQRGVPNYSTCFWKLNRDLRRSGKYFECGRDNGYGVRFPYVGLQDSIETIEAGTIVRLSLARWWSPADSDVEKRCYVQLSGWF